MLTLYWLCARLLSVREARTLSSGCQRIVLLNGGFRPAISYLEVNMSLVSSMSTPASSGADVVARAMSWWSSVSSGSEPLPGTFSRRVVAGALLGVPLEQVQAHSHSSKESTQSKLEVN